jgi:hypothetical protein
MQAQFLDFLKIGFWARADQLRRKIGNWKLEIKEETGRLKLEVLNWKLRKKDSDSVLISSF